MAILDFSKAFDTVPHDHLLGKMEFYGIQGPLLKWTASFLKTRSQSVLVEGKYSKPAKVLSGVPQGTVLGPLLFLIHTNDLPSVVTSQVRLFADDCLMYRPVHGLADQLALQADLLALERWGDAWGMRFNAAKCQIMQVYRGQGLVHFYTLCGQVLSVVKETKYLGVLISDDLSWSPHISSITGKAASTLGFLRRNLRKCPAQLKERAYIAFVRSTLDYASPSPTPHPTPHPPPPTHRHLYSPAEVSRLLDLYLYLYLTTFFCVRRRGWTRHHARVESPGAERAERGQFPFYHDHLGRSNQTVLFLGRIIRS